MPTIQFPILVADAPAQDTISGIILWTTKAPISHSNSSSFPTPAPRGAAVACFSVVAATPRGVAFEGMSCHSLCLDCECPGSDNAVSTIHALLQARDAFASIGAACTFEKRESICWVGCGSDSCEEGEGNDMELHG
jgi:hypothetical protein